MVEILTYDKGNIITTQEGTPMSKHTPGPWSITDYSEATPIELRPNLVVECGSFTVATICKGFGEDGEQEANANLIHAAPDLLKAAEEIINFYESMPTTLRAEDCLVINLRKARAKAKGK